jgi:hypothetical protein
VSGRKKPTEQRLSVPDRELSCAATAPQAEPQTLTEKEAGEAIAAYVNATPRKPRITAAEINKANAQFWAEAALRERVAENPYWSDELRALVLEHGPKTIAENLAAPERAVSRAIKATEYARQAKGIKESAEVRKNKNVKRDRRIHDAHAAGRTPKQIEGDEKIRGKKRLSASQIRRILKAPRP